MPTLWIDKSELRSSSITAQHVKDYQSMVGLEKLTGADMCLSFTHIAPSDPQIIGLLHTDSYFIQIKHGGDVIGPEQRMIELERMANIVPYQSQRYLLQVARPDSAYGQDYWREKAIHRNWNRLGVTDHIEKPQLLMGWLEMLARGNKGLTYVWRPIPKPKHRLEIITDYRRTLLSIPGVGLKTVLGLKSKDFFNAIDELISKGGKRAQNIQRHLANDDNY